MTVLDGLLAGAHHVPYVDASMFLLAAGYW